MASKLPESVNVALINAKKVLGKEFHTEDPTTLQRLTELRATINSQLSEVAGDDWDETFPEAQAVCARLTEAIQRFQNALSRRVAFDRRQLAAETKKQRIWRIIRTQSVDTSKYFSKINLISAIENGSMSTVYDELEKLLVYIRDADSRKVIFSKLFSEAGSGQTAGDLKPMVQRLLDSPTKDGWNDFLVTYFAEFMRQREVRSKRG